jgi:hypothetical protein
VSGKRMGGSSVDANVLGVRFSDGSYQTTAAVDGSDATQIQSVNVSATSPTAGNILIFDPILNEWVPGDPLVQGLFPAGTATSGINPILVGGTGADGLLHALSVDNSGNLNVDVTFPGTMAVTGTFWQATQPVSIASLPLPSGAATSANQTTELASLASIDSKTPVLVGGSIPVTGTFWQATQPVSIAGTVAVSLASTTITGSVAVTGTFWQATQPVSGTFWQATQPISGAVSFTAPQHVIVDSATLGTVAVSGAFYQATQPVSIASMPSTPVTGTFWQATQPVSGTFFQTTQPVSGTFWQATQPISGTISFTAPQHTIVDSGTITTVSAVTAITNALPAGSNTIGKVDILGNAGATLDAVITAASAPTNALATLVVYNSTPPTLTTGQSVAVQADTTGSTYVNTEGRKTTYRMCVKAFIPVASATSPTFSIQGSATKTIRITHIHVSWTCSTGTTLGTDAFLQRFSVLTGGTTGSTPTGALLDTTNAAQTAVCLQYSAVPTVATAVGGILEAERISWITSVATIYPPDDDIDWVYGDRSGQNLVLRGTGQYVGLVVTAVGTTPVMTLWIEWTEEA